MLDGGFVWISCFLGYSILALWILPASLFAGRLDQIALPLASGKTDAETTVGAAIRMALTHIPFLVMTAAYFVCGMQLIFITTHLPTYLAICGMDPMLSAEALGVIGAFNVLGSVFFGWAGGRW